MEIGGGVTLTEVIELMKAVASENEAYKYGKTVVDHLNVVSIYFLPDNMYNNMYFRFHIYFKFGSHYSNLLQMTSFL